MIRPATPEDVPMLARLNVQAWEETYAGLLPQAEIAARTIARRQDQWASAVQAGTSRILLIPDLGFAQLGPQRGELPFTGDYPEELYALYLIKAGQGRGHGRALLNAVRGPAPFTAIVLAANAPACAFYGRCGGKVIASLPDSIGQTPVQSRVYGWPARPDGSQSG